MPEPVVPEDALAQCTKFWCDWTATTKCDAAHAGAITLADHAEGADLRAERRHVAAPTTSLPEQFGSERNWDYRMCWLRDATLTLLAMMNAGIYDEAAAWRDWLQRAVAGSPNEMQIMYGLMGERRLTEWTVDWLPGYADSKPVRIGNAAHEQFQLDVYGELMDAFEQSRKGGLAATEDGWGLQLALLDHVAKVWDKPDSGIWETRGPRQHFVYSKVMAWVCFGSRHKGGRDHGPKGRSRSGVRCGRIHSEICAKGFDVERNTFERLSQRPARCQPVAAGADRLHQADDPRFIGTVEAIERHLILDGFVMRYNTQKVDDGLLPGEGAFLACSFWLADAYVSIGRREDAKKLFKRLLAIRNDLGLLAEEYDPRHGRLQGNFPQAFSHVALINTAFNLTRAEKPSQQRADGQKPIDGEPKGDAKNVAAPPELSRPATSSEDR